MHSRIDGGQDLPRPPLGGLDISELFEQLCDQTPATQHLALESLAQADPSLARELGELLEIDQRSGAERVDDLLEPRQLPTHGAQVGDYRLLECIGVGGMGEIWRAASSQGDVALKFLRPELVDSKSRRRLEREGAVLLRTRHPNLVSCLAVGQSRLGPYVVQEYIERGRTLRDVLDSGDQCESKGEWQRTVAGWARQIASALSAVHQLGIIHRDLKPENILFTDGGIPKVADFGIARQLGESDTRPGQVVGTPRYMSPEQQLGQEVSAASDVFSFGAVLFELLVLSPVFAAIPGQQGHGARFVASPKAIDFDVHKDLDTICQRCLGTVPALRYASMAEVHRDLELFLEGKRIIARPPSAASRAMARAWGRRWEILGLVALSSLLFSARAYQAKASRVEALERALYLDEVIRRLARMNALSFLEEEVLEDSLEHSVPVNFSRPGFMAGPIGGTPALAVPPDDYRDVLLSLDVDLGAVNQQQLVASLERVKSELGEPLVFSTVLCLVRSNDSAGIDPGVLEEIGWTDGYRQCAAAWRRYLAEGSLPRRVVGENWPVLAEAWLAKLFIECGWQDLGLGLLELAVEQEPSLELARYALCVQVSSEAGRIGHAEALVTLQPKRGVAWLFRGIAWSRAGEDDRAMRYYQKAAELDSALFEVAFVQALQGERDEEVIDWALRRRPRNLFAHRVASQEHPKMVRRIEIGLQALDLSGPRAEWAMARDTLAANIVNYLRDVRYDQDEDTAESRAATELARKYLPKVPGWMDEVLAEYGDTRGLIARNAHQSKVLAIQHLNMDGLLPDEAIRDEALPSARAAYELDPTPDAITGLASTLGWVQEYDEMIELLSRHQELPGVRDWIRGARGAALTQASEDPSLKEVARLLEGLL